PVLFRIGPLAIHSYGVMLSLSFLVGVYLSIWRGRKLGLDSGRMMDLAMYVMISSAVGARLFYVIPHWEVFTGHPWDVINPFQNGEMGIAGLTLYGGLILAVVVGIWFARRHHMPVWRVTDAMAPGVASGIFLTRIGCFLNGCCFGKPSTVSWAMTFPRNCAAGYLFPDTPIHPTQVYSSLYGLAIFGILMFLERFKRFDGFTFWVFILLYSVARFAVDFVRYYEESMTLFHVRNVGISLNQGISVGGFVLAWVMLFVLKRKSTFSPGTTTE
ncbi:MAG: prolipoprotein diacylglyceryl transferase, partial [Candidatus Latescibacterota bacterium]